MNLIAISYFAIPFFAFVIDIFLGDPNSSYHPVVMMGNTINYFEKIFYFEENKWSQSFYGMLTVAFVLATVVGIVGFMQYLISFTQPIANIIFQTIVLYFCISPQSLSRAARKVYAPLNRNKLERARYNLSMIVGRDTEYLEEEEIVRGTVETVAESIVDGIISPLLWYACFGAVGAVAYRAINTMDSMLGHKDNKYRYFGTFAARLDDLANFIPARITMFLIALAAYLMKKDWRNSLKMARRDAKKHPSVNSGYPEAAVAGALHIRLGGLNYYNGIPNERAYMGDYTRPLNKFDIINSVNLMYTTSLLGVILTMIIHGFIN